MDPLISKIASTLGKRGRGVPKKFTEAEREKRRQRMKALNKKRTLKKEARDLQS